MYSYTWDAETGGLLLNTTPLQFSKEPRPVYSKELDILGFNKYWEYDQNNDAPYMWAESNTYIYKGQIVARTKGGSLYTRPEIILECEPKEIGNKLEPVNIEKMVEKNRVILDTLAQETIKKIYNNYVNYKNKVDVFYVAFSGGKDSVVALDLVQRALPHNEFKVIFGDTGMEFPDTYKVVEKISKYCADRNIEFLRAKSKLLPENTWKAFGPPAVTNRWCCSVHKTSPQIMLLQLKTNIQGFTGMAFTGVRGDESVSRSEYDDISFGQKHKGQYSCHPILEWNTAELFLYIYENHLILNETYLKGNSRAGCLVCPMSSGKHEFMKNQCYPSEMEKFLERIRSTSGKSSFSADEMTKFIEDGNWKTRKTGRELNFGSDKHIIERIDGNTVITVLKYNTRWKEWAKTIGKFVTISDDKYLIDFSDFTYEITLKHDDDRAIFTFPNCGTSKSDVKFLSLFKSVIIKSIYCVNCGVCVAECTNGCIDMSDGQLKISDNCKHCYQCHEVHEHCLRYNSIRNKINMEKKMKGLDRYFSFGIRKNWIDYYFKDEGLEEFWDTDGHGAVPNKKKDAFLNFLKDADMVVASKGDAGNKYTKFKPSNFSCVLFGLGSDNESAWALMLANLVYTSEFNWFIKNIPLNENMNLERIKYLLEDVMEGDTKGLGKRNICDALKVFITKTPFSKIGLGIGDYTEKASSSGNEKITLNSFCRTAWENPDPKVVLYSLYKFAEKCGNYYQFTLSRLLDHSIESDGVSPTEIFGLDRETMERILNGLSVNYPDFISASFTLDLDNITLKSDKTSEDVLQLF